MQPLNSRVRQASLALALAAGLLANVSPLSAQVQEPVTAGDTPSYAFERALVNGQGTTTLADLQGKLVLIEFWGTY